jgi:hypothetical protein
LDRSAGKSRKRDGRDRGRDHLDGAEREGRHHRPCRLRLLGERDRHDIGHEQMSEAECCRKDDCRQAEEFPRCAHRSLSVMLWPRHSMTRHLVRPIDVDQARRDAQSELLLSSNAAK